MACSENFGIARPLDLVGKLDVDRRRIQVAGSHRAKPGENRDSKCDLK
jgi:hypothetical protein